MVNYASASSQSELGTYFERIIITFSAFKMGAYSRWPLIRGWALIRINTVLCFTLLEYSIDCIVSLFSPSNSWFANT